MRVPGRLLAEALKSLVRGRATILYPYKELDKIHLPEGFRGKIEFDRSKCIGCQLCFRVCPAKAIEMIEDEKGKRPIFYIYRCIYCAQCVEVCPTRAISMSKIFENIAFKKEDMVVR